MEHSALWRVVTHEAVKSGLMSKQRPQIYKKEYRAELLEREPRKMILNIGIFQDVSEFSKYLPFQTIIETLIEDISK